MKNQINFFYNIFNHDSVEFIFQSTPSYFDVDVFDQIIPNPLLI